MNETPDVQGFRDDLLHKIHGLCVCIYYPSPAVHLVILQHGDVDIEVLLNHVTEVDYLDITIFKGPKLQEYSKLDTKVFFKPTDTHQLLHKSHSTPNIPFQV